MPTVTNDPTAPAPKAAPLNSSTPITEADVLAFFAEQTAKYANQFPELIELRPQVIVDTNGFALFAYTDKNYNHISAYGDTLEDAAAKLRAKIPSPAAKAAKLIEDAQKMLAEAARLQGAHGDPVGPDGTEGTNGHDDPDGVNMAPLAVTTPVNA